MKFLVAIPILFGKHMRSRLQSTTHVLIFGSKLKKSVQNVFV